MTRRWLRQGLASQAALAAAFITLLACSPVAWGQRSTVSTGYYDPETSFRPELSPRDIHVIVSVLQLKPDEIAAVNTLYEGYASELDTNGREVAREIGEVIERAEVMQDAKLLQAADGRLAAWDTKSDQIKARFLEDLKSLLTKDQEARWPLVERELRRFKLIGKGRIAGENVDLTRVADQVVPKVWERAEATQVLEEYAAAFDHVLVARESAAQGFEESRESWTKLVDQDPAKAESSFQDVLRARRALREVNQRYQRQLEALLSDDDAARLRDAIFEKSFPSLFEQTYAQRYIDAACQAESLTPDQRQEAEAARDAYLSGVRAWRSRAASVLMDFEKEDYPRDLLAKLGKVPPQFARGFTGYSFLPEEHPLRKVRLERYVLDKDAREKVAAILSAAQRRGLTVQPDARASFTDYTPDTP